MDKKRILMVCGTSLCIGGVPKVIMTIVHHLANRYSFDALVFSEEEGEHDAEFLSYGGNIYRCPLIQYSEHKLLYPYRLLQMQRYLKSILREHTYDVIHCHNGIEAGTCLKVALDMGVPIRISHAHGNYTRKGKNKVLIAYNALNKRWISRYATTRLACSRLAGETLFGSDSFDNILNPVDYYALSRVVKKEHKGIHLVQIGAFVHNKNQKFSIDVLEKLLAKGHFARLSLVGFSIGNGYLEKLKEYVEEKSLQSYVDFLNKDAKKQELFETADILLLPSFSEGLPLVALEAQSAGVRCYASDTVSEDICLSFALRLSLNDIDLWVDRIISYSSDGLSLDRERLERFDSCNYSKLICQIYG